ncbi:MAG TPA: hypothetical protein VFD75_18600 [Pyrinomonadaceae bacterium]|nr:hypothetical protein [Pyrinomonadaceae bacterium]
MRKTIESQKVLDQRVPDQRVLDQRVPDQKVLDQEVLDQKVPAVVRLREMIQRAVVAVGVLTTTAGPITPVREIETATVAVASAMMTAGAAVATTTLVAATTKIVAAAVMKVRHGAQVPATPRRTAASIRASVARWKAMALVIGAIGSA